MWWSYISFIPIISVIFLIIGGNYRIATIALIIIGCVEVTKIATIPFVKNTPWLQRPSGARDCSFTNTGGAVGGYPGFPSGHAAVITYVMISVILLVYPEYPLVWIGGISIIILVCTSRLVVNCHTMGQVVAGTVVGGLVAALT